ncbi:hypothetical protein UY3_02625 [Chelonia mydas]|uniref:Uncharacterized protein n=1 Tax=Chelonia mydas TaxID=8469 RepID=M7CGR6_CHEMY|nr:hypothetical protein UY3_02625 [Chelonia mydas]
MTAKVVNIGLKRNVELTLDILKSISIAWDKQQKDCCCIADTGKIRKELQETVKKETPNNKVKLQAGKKRMDQALTPSHFLANILDSEYQCRCLTAEEERATMTRGSNHPSSIPTVIHFSAGGEPFKQYMFVDDGLKKVTPLN